jgi:peptide/nickel transport system ATP-binding protein
LARCLAGLEKPDSGEIWGDGEQVGHGASQRHMTHIQLVFQDPALSLSPRLTALDIVSEHIHRIAPNVQIIELKGPHMLLQAPPPAA